MKVCVLRSLRALSQASLAALFIGKTVKNILLGLCNLVYVFIMGLGLIYGGSLLKKMSKMSRSG